MFKSFLLSTVLLFSGLLAIAAEPFLWVEGENPTTTAHIVDNAGLNNINPYMLSGGKWLSSFTEGNMTETGSAEYAVDLPTDGKYHLWLHTVIGTGVSYQVDGGAWVAINGNTAVDSDGTQKDGGLWWPPTIAWYNAGSIDFTVGKHTIGVLLGGVKQKDQAAYAALDCFVLTTGLFTPNGKYKPDDPAASAAFADIPAGKGWDFTPAPDKLDPAALLDLRYLNEKVAGQHGFIHLSKDGNSFVRGDGQPIRFWAADASNGDLAQMKHNAQFLAKRGVNIIRIGPSLEPKEENSQVTDVDEGSVDGIFKTVAAMKSAGIYTVITPTGGSRRKFRTFCSRIIKSKRWYPPHSKRQPFWSAARAPLSLNAVFRAKIASQRSPVLSFPPTSYFSVVS